MIYWRYNTRIIYKQLFIRICLKTSFNYDMKSPTISIADRISGYPTQSAFTNDWHSFNASKKVHFLDEIYWTKMRMQRYF